MNTFRYIAIPIDGTDGAQHRRGEMTGTSAADVRSGLRRIGWQVIELKPIRTSRGVEREGVLRTWWTQHLRRRRQIERSDLCDSLATMLESGLPILECLQTCLGTGRRTRVAERTMLTEMRDALQGGASLSDAAAAQPGWFDRAQVAMLEAGQRRGELAEVLRHLAMRSARSEDLVRKLVGATLYPSLIAFVGFAVVLFLSVKTLPELARILSDSDLAVPALTTWVMWSGALIVDAWFVWILTIPGCVALLLLVPSILDRHQIEMPRMVQRLTPRVLRRVAMAGLSRRLAELLRTGIPVSEAMRIAAPTVRNRSLRRAAELTAKRIELGHDLAAALDHRDWFDAEYRKLVEIGQASGELVEVLERLGCRYERQSERLIDRLATLLEPAVIVVLAVLVGIVVMSAMLPLVRLQEILR